MSTGLSTDVIAEIRDYLIQHSCTGGVRCRPPPPGVMEHLQSLEGQHELRDGLEQLNLGCVKYKLMHPIEGEAWTRERADRVEVLYKRFLFMAVTDPRPFMPTRVIDEMWHAHILDTDKYRGDCQRLFGFYLDHYPYFGLNGDEEALLMVQVFIENCRRYESVFGEQYAEIPEELVTKVPQLRDELDLSKLPLDYAIGSRPTVDPPQAA